MGSVFDRMRGPEDLKGLTPAELNRLAEEIREKIIVTVSKNGGHLAPSLGVVELTLALHTVFDSPRDKIIWDVGHQSYAHKILTGRAAEFDTLRLYGGISGFPKRKESPHDVFETGHASTSISAALGMAKARDLRGDKNAVVAVIGDGSMTGGMAFEALDHAGHDGTDLIVVLNDNRMSIAPNVGALSAYLTRLRTDPKYFRAKADIEGALKRIPRIGKAVAGAVKELKETIRHLVVPGQLFEELGFSYYGPIDGHDIPMVQQTLRSARKIRGPVLVHVITQKGRGYKPAENFPDKFHGGGPFDIVTGARPRSTGLTYTDVFGQTLVRLAGEDPRIVAVTAAMPEGTGLTAFARRFPDRFFDVGIAEEHAVTFAAGLASEGYKPVFAVYSTFLQRGFDQVVHDVCLQKLPVVFAVDRAGLVGDDGETHQGVFDFAFLRTVPNLTVMAPRDENELQHMVATALSYGEGPVAVRYPRGKGPGTALERELKTIPIGKAETLRLGKHAAILAVGSMVQPALDAAERLSELGIEATVVNARFVKPLDAELIQRTALETGRIVTVEDHVYHGGFGSAVIELLAERGLEGVKVKSLAIADEFVEHGPIPVLWERYGLNEAGVVRAAQELLAEVPTARPGRVRGHGAR